MKNVMNNEAQYGSKCFGCSLKVSGKKVRIFTNQGIGIRAGIKKF